MDKEITKIQISEYLFVWVTTVNTREIVVIEAFGGKEIRLWLPECKTLVDVLQAILNGKRPNDLI